jgi:HPt (histidine-containing phosphotransfer) domain-containing protein
MQAIHRAAHHEDEEIAEAAESADLALPATETEAVAATIEDAPIEESPIEAADEAVAERQRPWESGGIDDIAVEDIAPEDIAPEDIAPEDIAPEDIAPGDIAVDDAAAHELAEVPPVTGAARAPRRRRVASRPAGPPQGAAGE